LVGQQVKDLGWLDYQIGRNDKILSREAAKTKTTGKDSDFILAYKDFKQRTGKDISIGQFRQQEWLKETSRDENVRTNSILSLINREFFGEGGKPASNMRDDVRSEFEIKRDVILSGIRKDANTSNAELLQRADARYKLISNAYQREKQKAIAAANNKGEEKENIKAVKDAFKKQHNFVEPMTFK
jgi:hypothetical protein